MRVGEGKVWRGRQTGLGGGGGDGVGQDRPWARPVDKAAGAPSLHHWAACDSAPLLLRISATEALKPHLDEGDAVGVAELVDAN